MSPRGKKRLAEPIIRTTIEFPERLWLKVKQRALDERSDFRGITMKALELYLRTPPKPKAKS
jgi:hypothetical protein